jgi:hypothetical protein
MHHAGLLAVCVVVGGGVYAMTALVAKLPEFRWLLQRAPKGSGKDGAESMGFD